MLIERYTSTLRGMGLGAFCALAVGSTVVWWVLTQLADTLGGSMSPLPGELAELPGWIVFWLTGSVYAVLIVGRFVSTARQILVVAIAGAFSYWLGVNFSLEVTVVDALTGQVAIAGAFSASFIAYVTVKLGTHRLSLQFFGAMAVAGAAGGAVVGYGADESNGLLEIGHGVWQVATCAVLYRFASPFESASPAADEGVS